MENRMPRILFLLTPTRTWDGQLRPMDFPHSGVGYLVACVRQHGVETAVLDTSLDYPNKKANIRHAIDDFRPDLIGITIYSSLAHEAADIVRDVQALTATPIIAGGPHISVTGPEFLEKTGVAFGVKQDGEKPLQKFILAWQGGLQEAELLKIPGLVFRKKDGAFHVSENTETPHQLDDIPFPDFSGFDLDKYALWRNKSYSIITSRGCPYSCTYCAAPLVTGRRFRIRSAKNVVAEIELYVNKGFKRFGVSDDAFNIDLNRAKEICQLIIDRKLGIVWDLGNGLRANVGDREFYQLLRRAGCNFVGFGLEAGNNDVLASIKKGLRVEQVVQAVSWCREAGIGSAVNFIIGHPAETYETARETLQVAETIPASYVNMYGLMPLKGTEAYRQLREMESEGKARFLYDYDYYLQHFSPQGVDPIFETESFTKEQRRELLKRARNLTKKKAFEYRLGKVLGRIVYILTLNHTVFTALNNVVNTPFVRKIYNKLRHED